MRSSAAWAPAGSHPDDDARASTAGEYRGEPGLGSWALFLVGEAAVEVEPSLELDHGHNPHTPDLDRSDVREHVLAKMVLGQAQRRSCLLDGERERGDVRGFSWRGHSLMMSIPGGGAAVEQAAPMAEPGAMALRRAFQKGTSIGGTPLMRADEPFCQP